MLPRFWKRSGLMTPVFEDLVERFFSGTPSEQQGTAWIPRADITDDEREVIIDLELPGMKKENIKVEIRNGVLVVSGERKRERRPPIPETSKIERHYGRFERSFPLPDTIEEDAVFALYEGGVLTLHLPKKRQPVSKQIPVEAQV